MYQAIFNLLVVVSLILSLLVGVVVFVFFPFYIGRLFFEEFKKVSK